MGSEKTCKYYLLILIIFLSISCGITIREYKTNDIKNQRIKISLLNKTHEPTVSTTFIKTIEEHLIKRGALIVDYGEDYEVTVVLTSVKTQAVAYTVKDVIGANMIQISGIYSIKDKNKNTPDSSGVFNISNNYNIKDIVESEIERSRAIQKSATEVAEIILGKIAILPEKP
ncbi:MAG: hypothetical protein N2202_03645 [Proteobacteria bacterium]|nr:hypothetical protein [Pseudomonadota bacterium]